ncbi:ATP-binding cassette domain-containing protein [Marichromatium gracile]|nr:excinuclease ABC subunit UvrA [Marichromatium gracile]MBK1710737.1 daunorubicin resistance protein DrrC [Marichromatium gracile]
MDIVISGACENNLKNVDVRIPRNKFVVVTGVSGSGKSSLVFDTLFAAAQSELLNSINAYARQAMRSVSPPQVNEIKGLSPAIAIDQKPLARNPRSTVGTVTDIYSFIRLIFSRVGTPALSAGEFSFNTPKGACESCSGLGVSLEVEKSLLLDMNKSLQQGAIRHRTWKVGGRYWNIVAAVGMFDMNKPLQYFSDDEMEKLLFHPPLEYSNHDPGYVQTFTYEGIISRLMKRASDSRGGKEYDAQFFVNAPCHQCGGSRLNAAARAVRVCGYSVVDLLNMEVRRLRPLLDGLEGVVAQRIVSAVTGRLEHLEQVGVGYLTMNRSIDTLSGGEAQRVKLARQLGSAFREIIYVLDEPSAGLHPADSERLVTLLRSLAAKQNSVVVVEHDLAIIRKADVIVDVGPHAGSYGGKVLKAGTPEEIAETDSPTGLALSGRHTIPLPKCRRKCTKALEVRQASLNNLKGVSAHFYKSALNCITGVSGSGKSSLIKELLRQIPDAIVIDQSPIGSSSRSVVVTYVDAFDDMRAEFARATGMPPSLFAFNSEGACPVCEGLGYTRLDMHFLGDLKEVCEACNGRRFNEKTLSYRYAGHTIADVLDLTVEQAQDVFRSPEVRKRFQILLEVGVGYLRLGQSLTELSGGERQRIKIAQRLSRKGYTYVLDEPTRGLHPVDVGMLVRILDRLVDAGNTVVVVEHDLDLVKCADWIVDLGPGGGTEGGTIVAEGTPEEVAANRNSVSGKYLAEALGMAAR